MTKEKTANDKNTDKIECGLIMPISKTPQHSDQHWVDVQLLLHRAISQAGLQPVNVWAGDLKDRVSERIVGNIFRHDVVVADISDLNPNVMLELGLRLASKKPTIVVVETGGTIPFDIRDFHALQYPGDLNILGMEKFFTTFATTLTSKLEAYNSGTYKPFLGDVVVEVLEPTTRNVSIENVVIERLEEIGRRISRIEQDNRPYPNALSGISRFSGGRAIGTRPIYFKGSAILTEGLAELVQTVGLEFERRPYGDESVIRVHVRGEAEVAKTMDLASALGLERADAAALRPVFLN